MDAKPPAHAAAEAVPAPLLFGWGELLSAVGQRNGRASRRRVRRLNDLYEGPILFPGERRPPAADRDKLVAWWNGLEARFLECQRRRADRAATLKASHPYGRTTVVLPDVAGHVQPRRGAQGPA